MGYTSVKKCIHIEIRTKFNLIHEKELEKNNDVMTAEYFPKGSSELSAIEECCRQGDDLLVSKYYPRFTNLKAITNYYRTGVVTPIGQNALS
jgi:hypothetical protein